MHNTQTPPYILKVKIDGNEFEFQCATYAEMTELGLDLLANTFGRYKADELRSKLAN